MSKNMRKLIIAVIALSTIAGNVYARTPFMRAHQPRCGTIQGLQLLNIYRESATAGKDYEDFVSKVGCFTPKSNANVDSILEVRGNLILVKSEAMFVDTYWWVNKRHIGSR